MKRVLFLTDFYYPNATSIGVCVDRIVRELQKKECEVHVVCFGEENKIDVTQVDGIRVHFVKKRFWDRCSDYKNMNRKGSKIIGTIGVLSIRIAQITHVFSYPYISRIITKRYKKLSERVLEKYQCDTVISSYAPMEASMAGFSIKKKKPSVYWIMYILDTFTNRGDSTILNAKQNDQAGWKWEQKFFEKADLITIMKCHERHHQQDRYKVFQHKMFFSDIPLLDSDYKYCVKKKSSCNDKKVVFAYTGRISEKFYSPMYWIRILEDLHKQEINYVMHFCGWADCEDELKKEEIVTEGKIKYHGLLSQTEAKKIREDADILVSFGAVNSEMIHSKIFEYMSLRKKIIHIQRGGLDSSVPYLERYPMALILKEFEDYQENLSKLKLFIQMPLQNYKWEDIFMQYKENMPAYTCELFERFEGNSYE